MCVLGWSDLALSLRGLSVLRNLFKAPRAFIWIRGAEPLLPTTGPLAGVVRTGVRLLGEEFRAPLLLSGCDAGVGVWLLDLGGGGVERWG